MSKIYIAIPRMQFAFRCDESRAKQLKKDGLAQILEVEWKDLDKTANTYTGHQEVRVRKLLKSIIHDYAR